ncbi:MAG TPA: phage minor head protein [Frateuria sp.]|uniref:phage head morphogenesis protein n=1 Tax=Frateuria sp. TaxID=2211372 RepID=UPI002DF3141D|nr:phage minor head protein [Frateuria sp.]
MPSPKPKTLRPVRPNAGLQAWYRRQLDKHIREMHQSLVYWLSAEYKAQGLAMDADGGATLAMRGSLRKLAHRWQWVFDKLADSLSRRIAERVLSHADAGLRAGVKGEGFTVKFTMTTDMQNAYQAVIGEQVGLIKSIAEQHLTEVEGLVMRSVARGRDLGTLTKELEARYGVTRRRAALIARDQNNKATSTLTAARQKALGITEGVWKHSLGGKHPRPAHLKASGTTFELAKGLFLDGKWVMPGEEINCRCTWAPVIPGFDA